MANKSQLYFIGSGAGSASVLDYFTANDAIFPFGSVSLTRGRNNHPLIIFPFNYNTAVDFPGAFPDASIFVVAVYWSATVTVDDVNWLVSFERDNEAFLLTGVDLDVDSFGPEKAGVDEAPAVSGMLRKTSIVFTSVEADNILPGEPYRVRVRRDSGEFPDTMLGDAQLFRVVLEGLP
jgi:hypothetical protein